jgi:hypothetical protein
MVEAKRANYNFHATKQSADDEVEGKNAKQVPDDERETKSGQNGGGKNLIIGKSLLALMFNAQSWQTHS